MKEKFNNGSVAHELRSFISRYDFAPVVSCAWRKRIKDKVFKKGHYLYDPRDRYDKDYFEPIFDLASITKTFWSTALLLALSEFKISLGTKVQEFLPDFSNTDVTISDLLSYRVKIEDELFFKCFSSYLFHPYSAVDQKYLRSSIRGADWVKVNGAYSYYTNITAQIFVDLLEKISGSSPKDALRKADTYFSPVCQPVSHRVVPSELRGKYIKLTDHLQTRFAFNDFNKGYPSDETAHALIEKCGVTPGMSGIFSTVKDLALFVEFIIKSIENNFSEEIRKEILDKLYNNFDSSKKGRDIFVCGFRVQGLNDRIYGKTQELLMGHVGFSGSMITFNPTSGSYALMLANPNYPVRLNKHLSWHRVDANTVRRKFNSIIYS
jgi:CubicO group peptidase (beta-lactamase class C family)